MIQKLTLCGLSCHMTVCCKYQSSWSALGYHSRLKYHVWNNLEQYLTTVMLMQKSPLLRTAPRRSRVLLGPAPLFNLRVFKGQDCQLSMRTVQTAQTGTVSTAVSVFLSSFNCASNWFLFATFPSCWGTFFSRGQ